MASSAYHISPHNFNLTQKKGEKERKETIQACMHCKGKIVRDQDTKRWDFSNQIRHKISIQIHSPNQSPPLIGNWRPKTDSGDRKRAVGGKRSETDGEIRSASCLNGDVGSTPVELFMWLVPIRRIKLMVFGSGAGDLMAAINEMSTQFNDGSYFG